jgi:DNA-binding transcriptional MocR family regulator
LECYLLNSPAWQSLDPVARAAYVEIAKAYKGSNNGRIVISARMLADGLGISKDTAARKLRILQEHGFIELVKQAAFSMKVRHAPEYRLTAFRCDVTGALPSKAFMRWQPEIQNTVRLQGQHGQTTGTDDLKTTPIYPFRSLSSDRVDADG